MYFSGVPRNDWSPSVDARRPIQIEESSVGVSSESRGMDTGRTESPPSVPAKNKGKRPAEDEPAQKKRKTAATAPCKPGGISLDDDQTNRTRRTAVFDWSDDDEILTNPPSSTKGPPLYPRTEQQTGVGEEVLEAPTRRFPEHRAEGIAVQQTSEIPAVRATEILGQQTTTALEQ